MRDRLEGRESLVHALYAPRPPFDGLVDFFWVAERYVAKTPRERVLPTGGRQARALRDRLLATPGPLDRVS